MHQAKISTTVRRPSANTSIVDIQGKITGSAEEALTDAYIQASSGDTRAIILNLTAVDSVDSSGIILFVTLLVRARRQKQRLLAYGLAGPTLQAFELTRLNQAIGLYAGETEAFAAANL
jgi:anti-anti-sigma factor